MRKLGGQEFWVERDWHWCKDVTARKVPVNLLQRLYKRGKNEAYAFDIYVTRALGHALVAICDNVATVQLAILSRTFGAHALLFQRVVNYCCVPGSHGGLSGLSEVAFSKRRHAQTLCKISASVTSQERHLFTSFVSCHQFSGTMSDKHKHG